MKNKAQNLMITSNVRNIIYNTYRNTIEYNSKL